MSDSGNDPPLQDLEPLDPGVAPSAGATAAPIGEAALQTLRAGLPPPAFNPRCSDATSYRFLMCGVLIVLGSSMPFSADLQQVGYKTMTGAFCMFVGIGMVWTWWAAIHTNRSTGASLKWLGLCFLVMLVLVVSLVRYEPAAAMRQARQADILSAGAPISASWSELPADAVLALSRDAGSSEAALRVEHFFRCFGTGRWIVLLGAALAEVFFVVGIAGGARQNRQQRVARRTPASERRRR